MANPPFARDIIFMAVSENSGKDNSGEDIYEMDKNGERRRG